MSPACLPTYTLCLCVLARISRRINNMDTSNDRAHCEDVDEIEYTMPDAQVNANVNSSHIFLARQAFALAIT